MKTVNFESVLADALKDPEIKAGFEEEELKENKMEFKHLHEVMKEEKINPDDLDKDFSVEDLIGFVEVNAPYSREEEKPAAKECMINEINIPDNMRFKNWDIDAIGDDVIQLNWTTQEPFTPEDGEKFIAEIKRFFEALVRREEFHKPFTVALEVMSRSLDDDDGHLVYDIDINKEGNEDTRLHEEVEEEKFWVLVYMLVDEDIERTERYDDIDNARADFIAFTERDPESYKYVVLQEVTEDADGEHIDEIEVWGDVYESLKEDLNNVTQVEDKAKEVMDPTFASAVREIRSHDRGREELKKLRKAPKEGEESLPKDLKMNLDESLFTEWTEEYEEDLVILICGIDYDGEYYNYSDNVKADAHLEELKQMSDEELLAKGILGYCYYDQATGDVYDMYISSKGDHDKIQKVLNGEDVLDESTKVINRIKSPISDDIELSADMKLRDAYTAYEPEEFQLDRLRNDITLKEVWEKMKAGEDIYELASVDGKGFDSAVREGIFVMLEMVLGIDYDTIYDTWLHPEMKESCSKKLNEGEEVERIAKTSEEYLDDIRMSNGWVAVEKIDFDTDYETIDVDDVLNKALASGWRFVSHPEHGLCIVAKGREIEDE